MFAATNGVAASPLAGMLMKVPPGRTFLEWPRSVTAPMVMPATSATVFDAVFRMAPALFGLL